MRQLIQKVVESIRAQDNVFYQTNCFKTWDDSEPTREVIAQGILDRLETFERFEGMNLGIFFAREGQTHYRIDICDFNSEQIVLKIPVFTQIRSVVGADGFFNYDEEQIILDFFTNNDIRH